MEDQKLFLRRGDWAVQERNFDFWSGTIAASQVTLDGRYMEGAGGVNDVLFAGVVENGHLSLEGARGPRQCTITADWPT